MGDWLVPCPNCQERTRFVLRPGKRYHHYEDIEGGQVHVCSAIVAAPSVQWEFCACGVLVQHVQGIGESLNSDCMPHLCAAGKLVEPNIEPSIPEPIREPIPLRIVPPPPPAKPAPVAATPRGVLMLE